ncbi:hypothetical protein M067_4938 [Bacteroides fragilis str. J-143-4]|uniref:hypothetical protein n=1 Tax=Bacteroides fragilis TaxID=817 RepID=UPI00044AE280|nr:hypothetical protein [Bacteroides fragilis]EXZ16676.1 hypothetical protein M067_4938 [Bacteroides fragilis str. J-143-4]
MSKIERAAKYYVQQEVKGMIDHDIDTGDMERAFIAGVEWAEKNKVKPKTMCLRNKSKVCDLCHECDVSVLNPSY